MLKTKLLVGMLMAAGTMFSQVSVGISIGTPPPPPRVLRVQPRAPGPGYLWVDGYWYPERGRYRWHQGYWTRSPYNGARWIAPRWEQGRFMEGYWDGDHGRRDHNHRWDRDRDRDWRDRHSGR